MEKGPLETATTVEFVDPEEMIRRAERETIIAAVASFAIGEMLFRLRFLCWCKHHLFYLMASAFIGAFLCYEAYFFFFGADRFGQRDSRIARWGFLRWLALIVGPIIVSLVTKDP